MQLESPTKSKRLHKLITKRLFDICFSLAFLTFFAPLFLGLSLAVKLSSQGPIFYRSRRIGKGGKTIYCVKFRSMYVDAEERLQSLIQDNKEEWIKFQKLAKDPRITPIGRFLRVTSLDEIPQFWNVLKGDLSVVGPRPPTLVGPPEMMRLEIATLYGEKMNTILSVRPGITGIWQISGRSQIPFEERCLLDEKYAKEHTLWKDLCVIAKTIPAVFCAKGAS